MAWVLARRTTIKSEYIRRRLRELELEVIAGVIKAGHMLAILAEDHYEQLVDFCRFDHSLAQPLSWEAFKARTETRPITDQDRQDLADYIRSRPYPSMRRLHSRSMVDFTLFPGLRTTNTRVLSSHRAREAGKASSLKIHMAGITHRRAIPASCF